MSQSGTVAGRHTGLVNVEGWDIGFDRSLAPAKPVGKVVAVDFQYHFMGGDVGPALGGQVHMHFREYLFGMNIGPIFLWDFRVAQTGNFKLYLAPLVALGYGFTSVNVGPLHGSVHFFFMDFGGQLKGLWSDRVGFFVRPANFSPWARQGSTGVYTLLAGVSLAF